MNFPLKRLRVQWTAVLPTLPTLPTLAILAFFTFLISGPVLQLCAQSSGKVIRKYRAKDKSEAEGKKNEKTINQVIASLRKEATPIYFPRRKDDAMKTPWPSLKPDYRLREEVEMDTTELLKVLSRRLHQNSPIDAYIRLHLLSFEPNVTYGENYLSDVRKILATMPAILTVPAPQVNQRNGFAVRSRQRNIYAYKEVPIPGTELKTPVFQEVDANSGLGFGNQKLKISIHQTVKRMDEQLALEIQKVNFGNMPVLAYRHALADHFSEVTLQFAIMAYDAKDRIEAGNESVAEVADKMLELCEQLNDQQGLDSSLRKTWIRTMKPFGKMHKQVPVAVTLDRGRISVQKHSVNFPTVTYEKIMKLLAS